MKLELSMWMNKHNQSQKTDNSQRNYKIRYNSCHESIIFASFSLKGNGGEDFFKPFKKIIKNETVFYSLIYKFSNSSTLFANRDNNLRYYNGLKS